MKFDNQYDMMTKQPVPSLILKLGLPTTISMLVTSIYNMADSYFVGKIGTSASGATGIVFGLMAILQAVGFMFGHGAGSIISRRLGARDIENARKFSATEFGKIHHPHSCTHTGHNIIKENNNKKWNNLRSNPSQHSKRNGS